jgi:hypothetical protein
MPELNTERLNMATHLLAMSSPYSKRSEDLERFARIADSLSNPDPELRLVAAATVNGAFLCAQAMGWSTAPGEQLVHGAIAAALDRVETGFVLQTANIAAICS